MNKWSSIICATLLVGCANKPYEPTPTIYSQKYVAQSENKTKIRVHRVQQLTGAVLGENCPLVLKVDNIEVAGLQQNQYIDLYLNNGEHDLSVRFTCAFTQWRKTLTVIADGQYQEIQTEQGAAGQYRMWRVK
ncbi:hypothetical protein VOF77_21950 [Leclercia adecarboxylata]|uniref:Lipoprotein n=1 Tax=Leclercia adecarboxylata TaxID=83655 RepID=A0A4U9I315_9ENTR|nr:hypothetical protein [Leclercia adecarboxylata]MEC3904958.1 hypothetical protein [Leclercia adecarboxylata]MEC3938710.1 hypothetical protein [Leclercia adecarboxylata]PHH04774.1 hypothetical protein CRX53_12805 [Leclercia adecarboxylata]UBH68619.1 hypothetical protein LA332_05005 [Leclercia adecarboxylata]VTP69559.1 Uncharacterised protein [Leclercia adecarboxylata]